MRRMSILVVDDHVDVGRVLAMGLEALGHDVRLAHSGADALALAEAAPFDVGVFDLGMDPMDGYELVGRMRERYGDRPYLVALSGYTQPANRKAAFEAGFDDHIPKPFDLDGAEAMLAQAEKRIDERRT